MKTFALFGMMLLAAGPALAQTASPAPHAPAAKVANPATMAAKVERRITQMHQELKITPEQQPAWDGFAQAMRDNATSVDEAYAARKASLATMSAPDNMRNFARIEQQRADGIQKLTASFQTLYDGMSDEQKKIADAMFRSYGERDAAHRKAAK
jgi:protein CpxP